MKKILWSKNHKYIMSITSKLDGFFYIQVYEVDKPMVELKIYGTLAHDHKWAFNQAIEEIEKQKMKQKIWQLNDIKL